MPCSQGFNGTLMAYGQTGTGKTYTMMSSDGICVLVVEKLFKRIHLDKYHDYKVCMSYLQIYQEKIFDLLNANSKVDLVLREDPKKGVYVENLSEFVVRDTAEVLSLLKLGKKKLIFAETRMNRVFKQITVERTLSKGGIKAAAEGFSSESSLLSPSSTMTPPSRKAVRSTGSLDRLRDETKTRSTPLKVTSSSRPQSFIPRKTSTPGPKRGLSRNNDCRHSFHLSSLPEMRGAPARPKPLFMGSGESLPNTPSASEGSDLQFCMDSELESGTESEGWDDDDESFLEGIRIRDDVLITGRININTIHALSEGKRTHIPYRNSSLTRLLQDSLGGNCKTSFVMCISPLLRDVNETRCTLDFGQRALKITTTAYVNVDRTEVTTSQKTRPVSVDQRNQLKDLLKGCQGKMRQEEEGLRKPQLRTWNLRVIEVVEHNHHCWMRVVGIAPEGSDLLTMVVVSDMVPMEMDQIQVSDLSFYALL
ncbi:hypothetical protein OS493_031002 [Desmophyllum pertusum]|uniref:Kinesin motor domain-containing protein n=1 Tax=Desmophyllum pertusum TaxID=174260 RepID=A0A9W9Z9Q3_9CNID|nr:hypothetical protein OS493_031002 [Desmophyllum pertusum]